MSPVNTKTLNLVSEGSKSWISKGLASAARRNVCGRMRSPIGRPEAADWCVGVTIEEGA